MLKKALCLFFSLWALLFLSSCILEDREEGEKEGELAKPISNSTIGIHYCGFIQEFYDCLLSLEYDKIHKLREALIDSNHCLDVSTEKKRLWIKKWHGGSDREQDRREEGEQNRQRDGLRDSSNREQDRELDRDQNEGSDKISQNQAAALEADFNSHRKCFYEFKDSVHQARDSRVNNTSFKKFIRDARKGLKECRKKQAEEFKTIIDCRTP